MAYSRYITVYEAVRRAMVRLGLPSPTTAIGSTDETALQMVALLQETVEELSNLGGWRNLSDEWEITLSPPTLAYALPDDFNGIVDSTEWDTTSRHPVVGSVPDPVWKELKARLITGTTLYLQYQLIDDTLTFLSIPSAADKITIIYNTRKWFVSSDGTTFKDVPTANDDIIRFDPNAVVQWLKMKWRQAKGFDITAAKNDAEQAVSSAFDRDISAPRLSLVPRNSVKLLGWDNIPDTGVGL